MDNFTVSELSYKNGFDQGFSAGENEAIRKMLMYLESRMAEQENCYCGRPKMSKFYNYCPYCGRKY